MRPKNQGIAEHIRVGADRGADGVCLAAITMPAAEAYVAFARLATAHLGGVVGLSVGRTADLGLAVDEACGQFMRGAASHLEPWDPVDASDSAPDTDESAVSDVPLELRFDRTPETLRVTVSGPIPREWPDRESLSWIVLDTLVADACCKAGPPDGVGTLTFSERLAPADVSDEAFADVSDDVSDGALDNASDDTSGDGARFIVP